MITLKQRGIKEITDTQTQVCKLSDLQISQSTSIVVQG